MSWLSLSSISFRSNIPVPATVDVASMLAVPVLVAITSKLAVPVAATIAKVPEIRIISLPTPESRGPECRTVHLSPSLRH
ncbi:hypothetical protein TIFTF001_033214 [Ficus carica]|uniref:Uncharacterized protein n=1 Tax=Ficus carica TaxID=3494 RepID=A0AA88DYJ4_FICCA|nr:hypothetical protein TIFTF001_033214 [Ficus carica]